MFLRASGKETGRLQSTSTTLTFTCLFGGLPKVPQVLVASKKFSVSSAPSSAPRTFTKIILPVVAMCGAKGIRLIAYLDDILVLTRNWRQFISHTSIVLDQAGFQQILKKCRLQPRQKFEYLRLQWDSKKLRVMLPADKITRFSSIRISIESRSEDGSNICRRL